MIKLFKTRTWLLTFSMIVMAVFITTLLASFQFLDDIREAKAKTGDNVFGYAWSEHYGWFSFNNCSSEGVCSGTDYGVSVGSNGDFSGYAWSDNIGWINFAPAGPYPALPLISAHYDSATGEVTGWAKVEALGDDGWLNMDGVSFAGNDFHGWAWNGNSDNTGVGWVSFNCAETGDCDPDYKVFADLNQAPTVTLDYDLITYLTTPSEFFDPCASTLNKGVYLRWNFQDEEDPAQSAYWLEIKEEGGEYGVIDGDLLNKQIDAPGEQYTFIDIDYGKNYIWRVKVMDSGNKWSGWSSEGRVEFISHAFPKVDFSYLPETPVKDDVVEYYDDCERNAACTQVYDGLVRPTAWLWSNGAIASSTTKVLTEDTTMTLTATDSDGYSCTASKDMEARLAPVIKEVKPG